MGRKTLLGNQSTTTGLNPSPTPTHPFRATGISQLVRVNICLLFFPRVAEIKPSF